VQLQLDESHFPEVIPSAERVSEVSTWIVERDGQAVQRLQWVIHEQPVTLYLNGEELVTLLCAGHHLDELAVGFLYAEGFMDRPEDIVSLSVDEERERVDVVLATDPSRKERRLRRMVTSGCGKGSAFALAVEELFDHPVESSLRVTPDDIMGRMDDLRRLSETYRRTHGVHNTILATPREVVLFRDDIGRHNAVDMVVGHAFLRKLDLSAMMLVTTGRLTSELLMKMARVRLPIVVSRNTATTMAVQLATDLNITLIGYARAGHFTVYAGGERVMGLSDSVEGT